MEKTRYWKNEMYFWSDRLNRFAIWSCDAQSIIFAIPVRAIDIKIRYKWFSETNIITIKPQSINTNAIKRIIAVPYISEDFHFKNFKARQPDSGLGSGVAGRGHRWKKNELSTSASRITPVIFSKKQTGADAGRKGSVPRALARLL